jgi:hypothetical protein
MATSKAVEFDDQLYARAGGGRRRIVVPPACLTALTSVRATTTAVLTHLYLVRVLDVASEERRDGARVRVIVTFYTIGGEDTGTAVTGVQPHQPLPRDASFFLRAL